MRVNLLVHLERVSPMSAVWWGESPEVPGFSVTDESLREMLTLGESALRDIIEEQGQELEALTVTLVTEEPESENPAVSQEEAADTASVRAALVTQPLGLAAA